jgi:integrase
LRRSEIARLRREDLTPWGLRVLGKGDKERLVPLSRRHAVRVAIERRPPGWLFPGRFSGHVHPSTVQKRVKSATGSSPHPFRARMATVAYAGTRDLFAVQRALGHASPETTLAYVALCDDAVAAVLDAAA